MTNTATDRGKVITDLASAVLACAYLPDETVESDLTLRLGRFGLDPQQASEVIQLVKSHDQLHLMRIALMITMLGEAIWEDPREMPRFTRADYQRALLRVFDNPALMLERENQVLLLLHSIAPTHYPAGGRRVLGLYDSFTEAAMLLEVRRLARLNLAALMTILLPRWNAVIPIEWGRLRRKKPARTPALRRP